MITSLTFLVSVSIILVCVLLVWIVEAGSREFRERTVFVLIVAGITAFAVNLNGLRDKSLVLTQSTLAAVRQISSKDSTVPSAVFAESFTTHPTVDRGESERWRRLAEEQQRQEYERNARWVDLQSRSGPGYVGSHEWRKEQSQPGYYYEMMKK